MMGLALADCGAPGGRDVVNEIGSDGNGSPGPAVGVLRQGGPLQGANGLHFGPDGLLYVASVVSGVIAVVDPDTGRILRRLSAEDGVHGPDDVAFGPDGTMCWTDIITGRVPVAPIPVAVLADIA